MGNEIKEGDIVEHLVSGEKAIIVQRYTTCDKDHTCLVDEDECRRVKSDKIRVEAGFGQQCDVHISRVKKVEDRNGHRN